MEKFTKSIFNAKFLASCLGLISLGLLFSNKKEKKVFISFPIEDKNMRSLLVGQSKNPQLPIKFLDASVYKPWEKSWKTNCREVIKNSDCVISLISNHTEKAEGQLWEMKCAKQEKIPLLCLYTYKDKTKRSQLPREFKNQKIYLWKLERVKEFVENS